MPSPTHPRPASCWRWTRCSPAGPPAPGCSTALSLPWLLAVAAATWLILLLQLLLLLLCGRLLLTGFPPLQKQAHARAQAGTASACGACICRGVAGVCALVVFVVRVRWCARAWSTACCFAHAVQLGPFATMQEARACRRAGCAGVLGGGACNCSCAHVANAPPRTSPLMPLRLAFGTGPAPLYGFLPPEMHWRHSTFIR